MKTYEKNGREGEPNGADSTRETSAIRAEIDETRERLSGDVDALSNKLSPENIKAEAKQAIKHTVQRGAEQVREGVGSAGNRLLSAARENPLPVAMIGVGLGWLVWNLRSAKGRSSRSRPDYSVAARSEVYDPYDARLGGPDAERDSHGIGERARDGVEGVKRAASGALHQAQDKLGKAADVARDGARRTRDTAAHTLEDQPLLLGALAMGAGLAVGYSIPATESENQLVGKYRDRFLAKAKDKARELGDMAKETARTAAHSGAESAKSQLRDAKLVGDTPAHE